MEQRIKFIFFIKISVFILSYWICQFYSVMNNFNKFLDEEYYFCRKLNTRIYRLLGNYKKYIYSYIGDLELNIPYNTKKKNEKLFTIDNEKLDKEKRETLHRCLLYKEKLIKRLMKNKCTMLHKSYNHYEKKIMNGLDDKYFFKKMMLNNDKDYKKLKSRKYGLRLFLLSVFFVVVLMIPILDSSIGNLLIILFTLFENGTTADLGAEKSGPAGHANSSWLSYFIENPSVQYKIQSILMYCVPILILAIILILGIFYYYKNVIKHKKIKFFEAFSEW
ncbi:Plasmodium exported protein, unknown function [Plasmodium malariae]|uniref:Fam-l protein n=1 Tax=Plasmodium malariae TaxID=5858 RepID=A0A1D3JJT6_PLAMA|nr:Plasmodium exported protein, unknown function [Plasmodium malariae]SBT86777.1 Plasmodium exported protein, unknown function [Plasmodium malariae]